MSKKTIMIIIGVIIGGISGYLYWKYIGCSTGTCAITSVCYKSTLYGMFMGGMLFDLIRDFLK
tara:strand:+ start:1509 stop:1697 length:189 start_codon:yes stop_codon:yes gene_type:complete